MIPHVIHYCWFGGNPLPDDAKKYIESWKKFCPDYEIKEWNETNFDVNCCSYVKDAYRAGKWAFVSDYARFSILYQYGGVYLDTDVEMIKSIDDIVANGAFMGIEAGPEVLVNSGLGMGAESHNDIFKTILDCYNTQSFYLEDGSINKTTVVTRVSEILYKRGYTASGKLEKVSDITIYPEDFFCPLNYFDGKMSITTNTRTIHHYSESWHNFAEKKIDGIRRKLYSTKYHGGIVEQIAIFPLRVLNKVIHIWERGK